ncbi:F-box only protein 21-like isoform X5 [Dreissena polymorpha]|uniref:F-box only protein 21-like isoform X1 n=1 Tax=Dreissena polymorpha TaxID=45954 RepID=UPI002264F226|nr:F-box only protein 21-like isoform X1 [Dreissena polymorpha]XP_052233733.1 F-box only protein 21-like isoform X2 [Dreissena polymorpha]XP_052233734.1 F-box only protein 21-like isoform X3 [Dreissena polymorpha]XP_052233735.1 F-box only protein 21-like isoform X4 [Dreissena polymorpha]XP_052233737.1 F-box only protein 21-like isoform X5 [Dreissena polymorpha]
MNGMEELPSFKDMPDEIIELILGDKSLNCYDLTRISETCSKLHQISNNNDLWKRKYKQRWRSSQHLISEINYISWKEEFITKHKLVAKAFMLLCNMSLKHFHKDELSKEDFHEFTTLAESHVRAGEFLVTELLSLLHDNQPDEKLTLKFYAAQVVRHIQHLLLKPKILAYLNDVPQEEQNIEIGAALVALWCQPTERIAESDVVKQLDELSDEVRDILQRAHPEHAVLHQNIIQDGLKEDSQTMEWSWHILDAINTVLYLKHSFKGGNFHNYCPQDNFIDKALKTKKGTPIIMCIIYAALARRLGVVLEPVNPPYHFMLRFKQHPFKPPDQMYVYINAFDGGKRLEFSDVAQEIEVDPDLITEDTMVCVTPCYVIELEVRNVVHIGHELGKSGDYTLLRTALEWSVLMKGDNIEARMNLARINLHLGVNLEEAQQMLQYVAGTRSLSTALFDPVAHLLNAVTEKASVLNERNKNHKIKVIKRKKSKTVEFAVGLVMIHKRLNYDCVISGWDYKCEASHEWKLQNPMTGLSQPFYIVLVEDGSRRYVAEEDLEVHPDPHIISHREVGKYFSTFDGYRYIMNSEKVAEYPDDEDFSKILVHRHFGITLSMTCNGFDDLFFFLNL